MGQADLAAEGSITSRPSGYQPSGHQGLETKVRLEPFSFQRRGPARLTDISVDPVRVGLLPGGDAAVSDSVPLMVLPDNAPVKLTV